MSQMYIIFPDKNTYLIFEKILPGGLWVSLYDDYLMPLFDARTNKDIPCSPNQIRDSALGLFISSDTILKQTRIV